MADSVTDFGADPAVNPAVNPVVDPEADVDDSMKPDKMPFPTRHYYEDNNPFRAQMPTSLMPRPPKFNSSGKPATINVNSHRILAYPKHTIYQYDVSPCRIFSKIKRLHGRRSTSGAGPKSAVSLRVFGNPNQSRMSSGRGSSLMAIRLAGMFPLLCPAGIC